MRCTCLTSALGRLIEKEHKLISHLQTLNTELLPSDEFEKLANSLDVVTNIINSLIDAMNDAMSGMPSERTAVWRPRLDAITELTGHLDNFAESFHIAASQECTAALAGLARTVWFDSKTSLV